MYVQLDESMFINDDLSNEEWDTDSNNEEETYSHDRSEEHTSELQSP